MENPLNNFDPSEIDASTAAKLIKVYIDTVIRNGIVVMDTLGLKTHINGIMQDTDTGIKYEFTFKRIENP